MIDKEAINAIAKGDAIRAAHCAIEQLSTVKGVIALPDDYETADLEKFSLLRRRARGAMTTASVSNFAAYVQTHSEPGATVFVGHELGLRAVAVLNLGTPAAPGHADNRAILAPEKTAAYSALLDAISKSRAGLSQRDLLEWMEDWAVLLGCVGGDGNVIPTAAAIDSVRRITIESARKVETAEASLSSERSAFEKVAATSAGAPLPAYLMFHCEPYRGMAERLFMLRLGVRTGDAAKPALTLTLRAVRFEEHLEQMASEFSEAVSSALDGGSIPVYVGSYEAKA